MFEYEGVRRVVYEGGATFVPVCCGCGRFVKVDGTVKVSELAGLRDQPNGMCARCGRTRMRFEGFL